MPAQRMIALPRLAFHPRALAVLEDHRQVGNLHERGGILLGEIHPAENGVFVTSASVPGQGDRSERFAWNRDKSRANEIIRSEWERSGGLVNYLGEWHTHPQDRPVASWTDRATMFCLVRRKTLVTAGLVLVIVGRESLLAEYWTRQGSSAIAYEVSENPFGG